MSRVVVVPNSLEKVIKEFLLIDAANLSHLAHDVAGCQVCLVLGQDTPAVGVTVRLDILVHALFDVLLIVSQVFLLLDEALPPLLLLLFFTLFFKLCHLLFLFFLLSFLLDFINFFLLLLLRVLWTVDPLNMSLRLIVLVHQGHDLIEFGLVLSFLLGIAFLSLDLSCLNISNFYRAERSRGILLFIIRIRLGPRLLLLSCSVLRLLLQRCSM